MIQPIQVTIDAYEYQALRNITQYFMRWTKSHYSTTKANGIAPEVILATMFEKHFVREVQYYVFPRKGKKLTFLYHEAKAMYDVLKRFDNLNIITILGKFDKALTDWRPCPATQNIVEWYEKNPLRDLLGPFDELGEIEFEIAVNYFQESTNLVLSI